MKAERNILIAFILNLSFSIFEFIGGIFTGSVAITSDAVHDIGDAVSIGISYFLEKKSKKQPDEKYTYGYARYSIIGGFITTLAVFSRLELYIPIIGIVYVITALSDIIQVAYYKRTKKRVFLMAPLHHHFERLGWRENDIVKLFWIGGFILSLLALIYGVWL